MIPIFEVTAQYQLLKSEIDAAVLDVLARGTFINGPAVRAFEDELAAYHDMPYAAGLNSGTDALHLALRALDIGPGDEVITTPFTFVATTEAIGIVGATPVFADINPRTYAIDPQAIEAAITPRTVAILPVHLYGHPAPMTQIMDIAKRHKLAVIEDCAQAIGATYAGARVGTIGTIGCLSFFPSKNLGACGDAGAIITRDPALHSRVRALRAHGGAVKYHHDELGVNSRLDELQAAILRVKLPYLDGWIEERRRRARSYTEALRDIMQTPFEEAGTRHVYHQYTVEFEDRDNAQAVLSSRNIQTMVYYPVPLHLQRVHAYLQHPVQSFPCAEHAAKRVLSLPMFPELTLRDQTHVICAIQEYIAQMNEHILGGVGG